MKLLKFQEDSLQHRHTVCNFAIVEHSHLSFYSNLRIVLTLFSEKSYKLFFACKIKNQNHHFTWKTKSSRLFLGCIEWFSFCYHLRSFNNLLIFILNKGVMFSQWLRLLKTYARFDEYLSLHIKGHYTF